MRPLPVTPLSEAPPGRKRFPRWVRPTVALLAVAVLCVLLFRRVDGRQLVRALAHADPRLLALIAIGNVTVSIWARAMRWKTLLQPLPRTGPAPRTFGLAMLLFACQAASNLLPARAGDAMRAVGAHLRYGYSVGGVVATQLLEKLIEFAAFVLLAVPVALLAGPGVPLVTSHALWALCAGVAVAVVIVQRVAAVPAGTGSVRAWIARHLVVRLPPGLGAVLERFFGRLGEALSLTRAPRTWLRVLGWSLVNDVADTAMIGLALLAVGVHPSIGSCFLVLIAINVAIALPSTPGQIGVLEAAFVLALAAVHVDPGLALAAAILYHASQYVPVTIVGLFELLRLGIGFGRRAPRNPSDARPKAVRRG